MLHICNIIVLLSKLCISALVTKSMLYVYKKVQYNCFTVNVVCLHYYCFTVNTVCLQYNCFTVNAVSLQYNCLLLMLYVCNTTALL